MPTGVEIERKFLVDSVPADIATYPSARIEQGYLAITDDVEVRLRRRGPTIVLTIKSSGDRVRVEEEFELDARRFESLWPLTEGRRLEKTRYTIPAEGGHTVELDIYDGDLAGLVTAEVEFENFADASGFVPAPWLGREVSDDPRYKNKHLASHGRPPA
jgi:CYTH domain-containing protein